MNYDQEQFTLFDLPQSRDLRNRGINKVTGNNTLWHERCIAALALYNWPPYFTGEDIRRHCIGLGLTPVHPNAWGALINQLVKRKMIVASGHYSLPKDVRSHARKIQLYRKWGGQNA